MIKIIFLILISINSYANEPWYIHLSLGLSTEVSRNESQRKMESQFKSDFDISDESSGTNLGIGLYYTYKNSLIGLYHHSKSDTMIGDLKSSGDDLRMEYGFSINTVSYIHYYSESIGNGYFSRLDIGQGNIYSRADNNDSLFGGLFDPDSEDGEKYEYDEKGLVLIMGGGKSWNISSEANFDLSLLYTHIFLGKNSEGSLAIMGSLTF